MKEGKTAPGCRIRGTAGVRQEEREGKLRVGSWVVLVLLPRRAEGREGAKSLGKFRANVRAGGKVQPQPASWSFFVLGMTAEPDRGPMCYSNWVRGED